VPVLSHKIINTQHAATTAKMSGVYEGLDSEETDFLNSKDEAHRPQAWLSISHVILCTSTLLFASISITQFLKGIPCQAQSAHQGYQTEWGKKVDLDIRAY
jgi:hypothetical protein